MREVLLDPTEYNERIRNAWLPMWVGFAADNKEILRPYFAEENADVFALERVDGKPALILGSGPSLDDMIPYLKDWKGAIFCSTSQLDVLAAHDIEADYCLLIDADPTMCFLMEQYESEKKKTVLLTHPCVPPEVFKSWKGKVRFFRMQDPGDPFFTTYLPAMYRVMNKEKDWGIRSHIVNAGCVVNAIIPAADVLGYRPLFLCGYDLGYPGDQYRFTNYKRTEAGWEVIPDPGIDPKIPIQLGTNGVKTERVALFYKYSTMVMWGLSGVPLISCSRGIMGELPYAHPADVVASQGEGYMEKVLSRPEAYKAAQRFLLPRGVLIIRKGWEVSVTNIRAVSKWRAFRAILHYIRWYDRIDWDEQLKKFQEKEVAKRGKAAKRFTKLGIPQTEWIRMYHMEPKARAYAIKQFLEDKKYADAFGRDKHPDNGGNGDVGTDGDKVPAPAQPGETDSNSLN